MLERLAHLVPAPSIPGLCLAPLVLIATDHGATAENTAPSDIDVADVPLVAWVGSRAHALPDTLPAFIEPPDRLAIFSSLSDALASSDWPKAREISARLSYELSAINEADTWFVIASDDSKTGRGPTLVINISPRSDVILEAPHVPFEPGTGEQALTLLRDLGGRAVLIAGAHRCASRTYAQCSGKTAVYGLSLIHI